MDLRLENKIAFISGAGSGIGKAIAYRFGQEGAKLVVNDINEDALDSTITQLRNQNIDVLKIIGDVSDEAMVKSMVEQVYDHYNRCDILVNNAGIGSAMKPILRLKKKQWDKVMQINLTSVFLMSKYFGKRMKKNEISKGEMRGKIINISSMRGKSGRANYGDYVVSKFGVIGLTQTLAQELGKYNITVNAICPGLIHTPIYGSVDYDTLATINKAYPTALKDKPVGLPEDVAGTAFHIASNDANWITGQSFAVSGGQDFF